MTPPEARLIQHDNRLKQLAWDKEASDANLKTATETRKYWEAQDEELKKSVEEIEKELLRPKRRNVISWKREATTLRKHLSR